MAEKRTVPRKNFSFYMRVLNDDTGEILGHMVEVSAIGLRLETVGPGLGDAAGARSRSGAVARSFGVAAGAAAPRTRSGREPATMSSPHGRPLRVAPCPPRGPRFALGRPGGETHYFRPTTRNTACA